jgi:ABC-type sugar transport system permease subunit
VRRLSKAPHSRRGRGVRHNFVGWLFLAPAVLLIGALTIAPFGQAILLSFQEWDGISPETPFVGFENYATVLKDDVFWDSMKNVLVFAVVGFFLGNGGLMFSWLLEPRVGIVNLALKAVGLDALAQNWLGNPNTALVSVALVFVWYHWGFAFILFLAGLQDIPAELYEAASLDGARAVAKFRYITWPHLAPVTTIVSLLTLLAALQVFGTVQVLTNGGPGHHTMVPTLQIYVEAFGNNRYGTAAAMSVLFGGALVVLAVIQLAVSARRSRA